MKVLIAEDEGVSRTVLRRTVERLGHECLATRDGSEAWELFQKTSDIDAVISDWKMPEMDGLELCRRIRSEDRRRIQSKDRPDYTFFIFLTGVEGQDNLLEGMQAGADEYLTKPPNSEQLKTKLDSAAKIESLQRHLEDSEVAEQQTNGKAEAAEEKQKPSQRAPARKGGLRGGKIWDILVSRGKLTEDQLHEALEAQKQGHADLGTTLVELGYITQTDLARAQAERLNLEYLDISERDVDRGTAGLVEQKVLQRHGVLPLKVEGEQLVVAMSEPTNIHALEDLGMITGYKVRPVVATDQQIRNVMNQVLAVGSEVTEILEEAGGDSEVEDSGEVEIGAGADAEEAPIVRLVRSILQQAVGEGASDIHIEPRAKELKVRYRVDGVLRETMSVPQKLQNGVIARLKILANLNIAERRVPQDGRFTVRLGGQKVELRVASLPTVFGEKVVLRLLDTSSVETSLTKLGFAPEVLKRYREIFTRPYGTVLVTGPTGSGKSTTLYATLGELNSPEKNIITVEDPVEYRMSGISQVQVNSKVGLTFASGLRSILRSDPDIMMIGEIRDYETAKISIEAALTGHLVLATLHTNSAPAAVNRLTEMGVETYLTSSAVDCVIAQRLARRLCANCMEPVEVEQDVLDNINFPFESVPEGERSFYRAVGCGRCGGSGYKGRVGIYEMMAVTDEIRDMVLRRVSTGEISRTAEEQGMIRLREDGLIKAAQGMTTIEEVLRTVV